MSLTSDHPSALYFNQCNRDQLFFWVYCYNIDRYYWLQWRKMQVIISKVGGKFWCWEGHISIKHDLARSCFQFWLKIGDEGDKISRKKTSKALAETVFSRNFVTLGADFESQNWKPDLARLCFMLYTPSFGNSWKKWKFCNWVVRRRRPLWCQWRPLCGFGNFGKKF